MNGSWMRAAFEYARRRTDRLEPDPDRHPAVYQAQQVGTVIQVGVIGIAIIIMILVYSQVDSAIGLGGTEGDTANNTALQNAAFNATDTFGQAMELAPVIMIVLLAAVVIAVVQRFRS